MRTAFAPVLLLAAVLAAPAPAAAQAEPIRQSPNPSVLVLYEEGDDPVASRREAMLAWKAQKGRWAFWLAEFRPIDTVLPDDAMFVLGSLEPTPCADGRAVPLSVFDDLVADSGGALAYLEFDAAAGSLDLARRALPCLAGVAAPETLSRYHLLRGVSSFYSAGPEASQDEFRRGLLVSPFLQWDTDYPPDAQEAFRLAVGDALRTGRGMLSITPGVVEQGELWIDGVPVDPRMRTRDLFEGQHLLQWQAPDGHLVTLHAQIPAGGTAALEHRTDLVRALVTRDSAPLEDEFLGARLDAAAAEGSYEEVVVAHSDEQTLFHLYDPAQAGWTPASLDELRRQMERGRRQRSLGLAIGLGGAALSLLGVGMVVAPLANGLNTGLQAASAIGGLVLFGVGGGGLLTGMPLFIQGNLMAKGRDRLEFQRYSRRARLGPQ